MVELLQGMPGIKYSSSLFIYYYNFTGLQREICNQPDTQGLQFTSATRLQNPRYHADLQPLYLLYSPFVVFKIGKGAC